MLWYTIYTSEIERKKERRNRRRCSAVHCTYYNYRGKLETFIALSVQAVPAHPSGTRRLDTR